MAMIGVLVPCSKNDFRGVIYHPWMVLLDQKFHLDWKISSSSQFKYSMDPIKDNTSFYHDVSVENLFITTFDPQESWIL